MSSNKTLGHLFVDFALGGKLFDIGGKNTSALVKSQAMATVSQAYKESLNDLMTTLQSTFPHFIRCIIPNHEKRPHAINDHLVLDQLNCNGVLEGVRISRLGYPNRLVYEEFVKRYFIIVDEATKNMGDKRAATKKIIDKVVALKKIPLIVMNQDSHAFGKTKIFFKVGVLADIDRFRGEILSEYAIKIQALARGYHGRKSYSKLKDKFIASTIICDAVRDWITLGNWAWYKLFVRIKPMIPSGEELRIKKQKAELEALRLDIEKLRKEVNDCEETVEGQEIDRQTKLMRND